jgi:hypothetical protein
MSDAGVPQAETITVETIFNAIVFVHVIVGSVGLASFWLPVFAPKRRGLHTRAGRVFAYAMMATGFSAALASTLTLLAPLATHPETSSRYEESLRAVNGLMLLYLAVITFLSAFGGLRAVRLKSAYGGHRERLDLSLNILGFILAAAVMIVGWRMGSVLMMGLSLIGLLGIPGNIRLLFLAPTSPREWKYHHLSSMLGAGIAAHTAFLVFGAGRFVDSSLTGHPLVWLAPTLVGVPAIRFWKRYYRRQEGRRDDARFISESALEVKS